MISLFMNHEDSAAVLRQLREANFQKADVRLESSDSFCSTLCKREKDATPGKVVIKHLSP